MKLLIDMNLSPWLLQMTAELERGALVTVDHSRARLRILPLIPDT